MRVDYGVEGAGRGPWAWLGQKLLGGGVAFSVARQTSSLPACSRGSRGQAPPGGQSLSLSLSHTPSGVARSLQTPSCSPTTAP